MVVVDKEPCQAVFGPLLNSITDENKQAALRGVGSILNSAVPGYEMASSTRPTRRVETSYSPPPARPLVTIVEDDAALMTMLSYNLERQGFRVEEATDGEEALARIRERRPDLVLLDWMLPVMSGLELCRQIRRCPAMRGLPLIMLSARTGDRDVIVGLDTGADDYIAKPSIWQSFWRAFGRCSGAFVHYPKGQFWVSSTSPSI